MTLLGTSSELWQFNLLWLSVALVLLASTVTLIDLLPFILSDVREDVAGLAQLISHVAIKTELRSSGSRWLAFFHFYSFNFAIFLWKCLFSLAK